MYERFTDNARAVMQDANRAAQEFGHDFISTEHMLLALVELDRGVAIEALHGLEIDVSSISRRMRSILQKKPDRATRSRPPQISRAKQVIERAMEEAQSHGHRYVGTEHLLLGMLQQEDTVAPKTLAEFGVELDLIRKKVLHILDAEQYHKRDEAFAKEIEERHGGFGFLSLGILLASSALIAGAIWLIAARFH